MIFGVEARGITSGVAAGGEGEAIVAKSSEASFHIFYPRGRLTPRS